jgi:hypothetical protein
MRDTYKYWIYWCLLIVITLFMAILIFTSIWVRLSIFIVLVVFLIFDTFRQVDKTKTSIIFTLKKAIIKFFDYLTSL